MSDTEQYVEKIARAWHKHIQEINAEIGLITVTSCIAWENESDNAKRDICNCTRNQDHRTTGLKSQPSEGLGKVGATFKRWWTSSRR